MNQWKESISSALKKGSNPSGENGKKHVNILTPGRRRDLSDVDGSPAEQAPCGKDLAQFPDLPN